MIISVKTNNKPTIWNFDAKNVESFECWSEYSKGVTDVKSEIVINIVIIHMNSGMEKTIEFDIEDNKSREDEYHKLLDQLNNEFKSRSDNKKIL